MRSTDQVRNKKSSQRNLVKIEDQKLGLENKKLMISIQNPQKLGVSDHQFDFGTSPSMGSTD